VFAAIADQLLPDEKIKAVLSDNQLGTAGIAIHKDDRLFVAGLGNAISKAGNVHIDGPVFVIGPDGKSIETIISDNAAVRSMIWFSIPRAVSIH
jgi:lactonase